MSATTAASTAFALPRIMGVLNVTPDSFSDGGRFLDRERAIAHGVRLAAEGAQIIDVGGESTRPGSEPVTEEEELARTTEVVRALARKHGLSVSIDTSKAAVAAAALEAGATMVNDVGAMRFDPEMPAVVAGADCEVVLMHCQGRPRTMQNDPVYENVGKEVAEFLEKRVESAQAAGIARERILIDPGIGFGKTLEHNLALLRQLGVLRRIAPVVLGMSRKSFIGAVTGAAVDQRLPGSLAAAIHGAAQGAAILRVHDVAATHQALTLWAALQTGESD